MRSRGVYSDAAAQYCADTAYEVFAQQQQARRSTGHAQGAGDMAGLLGAVLAALDRRFLNDPAVMPQVGAESACGGWGEVVEWGQVETSVVAGQPA